MARVSSCSHQRFEADATFIVQFIATIAPTIIETTNITTPKYSAKFISTIELTIMRVQKREWRVIGGWFVRIAIK